MIVATLADILLRSAEAELYRLAWSDDILTEVEWNLAHDGLTTKEGAQRRVTAMREAFPTAIVHGYHPLVEMMPNNPKDRHVLAAAVIAKVRFIVTSNLRHFPAHALVPHRIEAMTPDDFLLRLDSINGAAMATIVHDQAADLRRPPMTALEVLERLSLHTPRFATRLIARLERGTI
jgi:predicted nucleic acid-binding protein